MKKKLFLFLSGIFLTISAQENTREMEWSFVNSGHYANDYTIVRETGESIKDFTETENQDGQPLLLLDECGSSTPSNNFENAYNTVDIEVANDFFVEPQTTFTVGKIIPNIFSVLGTATATVKFYNNDNGTPGQLITSFSNLVPANQTSIGTTPNGFEIFVTEIVLPAPVILEGGIQGASYWVTLTTTDILGFPINFWEVTSVINSEYIGYFKENGESEWTPVISGEGISYDGVFSIEGSCETLDIIEIPATEFTIYPNPVRDKLTIESRDKVALTEIFDLSGRKIHNGKETELNLYNIPSGVYLLKITWENGRVTTKKIIKE